MAQKLSNKGARFIESFEGTVLRAYRCPAGRMTIGTGFTSHSRVFADYWQRQTGSRQIKKGQRITREASLQLLPLVVDAEYGAAVSKALGPLKQSHYDGSSSMTFNCGPGALKWKWAQALKRGDVAAAARHLRVTAVTANGKRLSGLVRRRAAEARLIETGNYGTAINIPTSRPIDAEAVSEYQQWLRNLGYKLTVDGIAGPQTEAAVKAFQRNHPHLDVDGIVGPATRAALLRAMQADKAPGKAGSGAVGGGATGAAGDAVMQSGDQLLMFGVLGAIAGLVVIGGFLAYRYRDELEHFMKGR